MTPVEIADHASGAQDALHAEIVDMLRASDEFGWVFDKLEGWHCNVSSSTDFPADLRAKWSNHIAWTRVSLAAELGMLPEWKHDDETPERPRAVLLDVERPTWWPGGANKRDSVVQASGQDAVTKWGELVPDPSCEPIPFTSVDCLRCIM